jgi:protein TonB
MVSKRPESRRFFLFLLISALVHLGLFAFLILGPRYFFLEELNRRLNHSVENKTEDLVTQIELINNEDLQKQVVEQSDNSVNEEVPEDTKFLSAKNQKVKKETKAFNNGKFNNSNAPGVTAFSAGQKNNKKPQDKKVVKNFGLNGLPLGEIASSEDNRITKSYATLGDGVSQTDDFLKDIDEGAQTLLNTKEFIYYSFFMRIKDQVRSHWNPRIRKNIQILYAKDRNVANLNVKATSVRVTLNRSGYLEKVELLKTSGYKELDVAAIQAFRAAAPFLNPPAGLLEEDQRIRIVWDFIVES